MEIGLIKVLMYLNPSSTTNTESLYYEYSIQKTSLMKTKWVLLGCWSVLHDKILVSPKMILSLKKILIFNVESFKVAL